MNPPIRWPHWLKRKPKSPIPPTERLDAHQFALLSTTVAATLAVHLAHLPIWLSLSAALALALRIWNRQRNEGAVAAWIRLPFAALLVVLVVMNYGNLFGREPGSVLACGLLALKILETERVRDARVALGFAAFVLMSALLFTQTLLFTALICAVLLLLLAAMVSLQPAPLHSRRSLRRELRLGALLLGASLPLAAAAFVLVPRLSSPLWGAPGNDTIARTGLSDTMAPGSMTELLIDDSPALRIAFDDEVAPAPALRYFRALVLWDFDGSTWSRGFGHDFRPADPLLIEGDPLDYTVTLEATDRRWLPTLDMPLEAPSQSRLGVDRVALSSTTIAQPRQYRVRSATRYVLTPQLSATQRARALALPEGFDPRSRALAAEWRARNLGDQAVMQAALDLFHDRFTYTLTPPLLGRNGIDDFLFETQRGFCEHYAGAFVFLMRAAGIPARVVTGYQGGWWNANNAYLLVRQSDAHAWAEIWTEDRGWQRVDPTAAVSPERIELGAAAANDTANWSRNSWLRDVRNRLDVVNRIWTQGVIRFDALRQKSMLTPFGVTDANQGDLLLALSIVLGLVLIIATLWAVHGSRGHRGDSLDRAWSRLLDRLHRAGIVRRDNEGPLDLLERLRRHDRQIAEALAPLIADYAQLRYGTDETGVEDSRAWERRLRRLRLPRRAH